MASAVVVVVIIILLYVLHAIFRDYRALPPSYRSQPATVLTEFGRLIRPSFRSERGEGELSPYKRSERASERASYYLLYQNKWSSSVTVNQA